MDFLKHYWVLAHKVQLWSLEAAPADQVAKKAYKALNAFITDPAQLSIDCRHAYVFVGTFVSFFYLVSSISN